MDIAQSSGSNRKRLNFVVDTSDVTEDWTIRDVAIKRSPRGWVKLMNTLGPTFDRIEKVIEKKKEGQKRVVVPLKKDLFTALHWCANPKVIIIGQDPYYTLMDDGTPDAVGAAFSTRRDARLRDSIRNIFLEVKRDYPDFKIPEHGDLSGWAKQGVLLLNVSFTTFAGQDKAHKGIWMGVTKAILDEVQERSPNAVALLWGKDAQDMAQFLGKLIYFTASHPSPKSAERGFFGCNHFKLANEHLISKGCIPIDWTKLE